jgi:hypothetical protein
MLLPLMKLDVPFTRRSLHGPGGIVIMWRKLYEYKDVATLRSLCCRAVVDTAGSENRCG